MRTSNISRGSIRIMGSQIKRRRRQLQLSQTELAVNICTQGLISLIENKNVSPSIDIVYKICERLDLNIHDVITSGQISNKTLDLVEGAIWKSDYEKARQLIAKVNVANLASRELKSRYYCYLGDIHSKADLDYLNAIKNFEEVLVKYSGLSTENIYTTWAHIGMAKAYFMLNDLAQAEQFNELATSYLKIHQFSHRNNFKRLINIYVEAIDLQHHLLKHEEAMVLTRAACQFLRSIDSMYQLGPLNLAMARGLIASDAYAQAICYLDRAHHFGDYYNDDQLIDQVDKLRTLVTE
ncbi:helix-turn-helix domain-containing protein [Nicoliella spurrieriana]|uniref:Helix-turn-helix domain-containing protein n=2 Tax=Nicoliella spurrieriana TaxID=2925830 RepID=A0A976X5K8_9LACO|nr:helix-turn-helix domain-containing protein [Nicoliella spurrieriana]